MPDGHAVRTIGRCWECGKQSFKDRKTAKRAAQIVHPGEQMRAYRCGDAFHLGHLDERIVHGDKSR